jgi:drug/metabolite transporter (DMT)-like permease
MSRSATAAIAADAAAAHRRGLILGMLGVIASVMCFAISFSIIKWPDIAGSVIAWWRLVGSAILWWVLLVGRRLRTSTPLPSRATWVEVTPAALFFGVNISLLFLGVTRTSVVHSEFIAAMAPLLLIPAGVVFFGEHPNWKALRWGLLSMVGLVIVLSNSPAGGEATLEGDLIVVGATIGFAAYQLLSKRTRRRGVDLWDFMTIVMTVGLVTATPVAVATGWDEMWPLSTEAWIAVILLSLLTGMIGHGFLYFAQRSVPISTISIIQAGQPSQSALWAWLLLGETIALAQVPGMILVTLGIVLVVWFSQRSAAATAAATPATPGQPAR